MKRAGQAVVFVVLGALGAALSAAPAAQEQPFRSGVDVAELDVSVVDRRGRPITDLDASEFTVRIDGQPRRVVEARRLSPEPAAPGDRRPERPGLEGLYTANASGGGDPRGRRIVIVVDRETLVAGEGWNTFRAAADFIDRLHPSDRVALYPVWNSRARIDFTIDHRRVRREVARMSGQGDPWSLLGTIRLDAGHIGVSEAFAVVVDGDEKLLERIAGPGRANQEAMRIRMHRMVQEVRLRAVVARREVEDLLSALRAIEGPKAVVWISGGFVVDQAATRLVPIEELAAESRTTLFTFMAGEVVPFDMGSAPRYANRTPRYTQDQNLLELGLSQAARRTGGQFFRVIGNPRRMFERIEAQLSGHYLLGVEVDPADPVEDRRRIEVTVERGGAEVRLRHGNAHARVLRELRPGEAVTGSVDERLMAMLRSPDAEPWLPLRVSTYAYPDGGGQARVTVTAEVGGNGVDAADVTLGYALLDTWGAVVSSGRRRMPGTAGRRRNDGAHEYTLPFTAAPGRYALRVAAVDGSGRGGSVEHPLRAGMALSDAPLAFGTLEVVDAEAPGGAGPEAEAVVSSGEIAVALDVHAESSWVFNRVSVAVEVARDEEGPALAQAEAPLRGRDDAPLRSASARLAVGELSPGRYVARVRVLRGGEEATRIHRSFRIAD